MPHWGCGDLLLADRETWDLPLSMASTLTHECPYLNFIQGTVRNLISLNCDYLNYLLWAIAKILSQWKGFEKCPGSLVLAAPLLPWLWKGYGRKTSAVNNCVYMSYAHVWCFVHRSTEPNTHFQAGFITDITWMCLINSSKIHPLFFKRRVLSMRLIFYLNLDFSSIEFLDRAAIKPQF